MFKKRTFALAALVLLAPLSGCTYKSKEAQPGIEAAGEPSSSASSASTAAAARPLVDAEASMQTLGFHSGGLDRTVHVFVPASRSETPGLLVLFHGLGDSGEAFATAASAAELAERFRVVVAVPEGTRNRNGGMKSWNAGACCAFGEPERDDSSLLADLIDRVETVLPIERAAVDIAGFSNGGYFVEYNACKNSELIRGGLNVAGSEALPAEECQPTTPVRLLRVHGELDDRVPFEGGEIRGNEVLSFNESFVNWRSRVQCSTAPRNVYWGAAICRVQDRCQNGAYVSCQIPRMGHEWPDPARTSLDVFERAWQVWTDAIEP